MNLKSKTKEELNILSEFLNDFGCVNQLESMFSQQPCAHCDMQMALNHELSRRALKEDPGLYGRTIKISLGELNYTIKKGTKYNYANTI